ncbi:FERM domain-containing protein 4A-like isoform X2 [Lethenteron reissneri]|uniref:FERM domain-containing protein 4A-like isoform X2 n=1 Tax=Lethenteron reissneri TaxID=7753 RepID=UPI002AB608FD|nr:FERM domain-containing protein 4A-like isoform X2 [Lethenteron reissneri]
MMAEGRRCQIHLLDARKLELLVQPKLQGRELLDLVASHFNLKEKEFFGLSFFDDAGHHNWLHMDRRVLDHDFPKQPTGPLLLSFAVRFYIEDIAFLKDSTTVELFYLNAQALVHKGQVEVDTETAFALAAYALQEAKGDYTSEEEAREHLQVAASLPVCVLKQQPGIATCESRVIEYYKKLQGHSRGQAIVNYMKIIEASPSYGVHLYGVKDKQGTAWWLGICTGGIFQYDFGNRAQPRQVFPWKELENLYFRDKKFLIEVQDTRRQCVVSRRSFGPGGVGGGGGGGAGVVVHTWYGSTSLIKCIWAMAISQHQFYLDRKQSMAKIAAARSLGEMMSDLDDAGSVRAARLTSVGSKNLLNSRPSSSSLYSTDSVDTEANDAAAREMLTSLRSKQSELQEQLHEQLQELRKICLREAELTGKLPAEFPLQGGETLPRVRRRVGATFRLDETKIRPKGLESELERLETEFSVQEGIVQAALKLAKEEGLQRATRRRRKADYAAAAVKLQAQEAAINALRERAGRRPTQRASVIVPDDLILSEESSISDGLPAADDDISVKSAVPAERAVTPSPLEDGRKGQHGSPNGILHYAFSTLTLRRSKGARPSSTRARSQSRASHTSTDEWKDPGLDRDTAPSPASTPRTSGSSSHLSSVESSPVRSRSFSHQLLSRPLAVVGRTGSSDPAATPEWPAPRERAWAGRRQGTAAPAPRHQQQQQPHQHRHPLSPQLRPHPDIVVSGSAGPLGRGGGGGVASSPATDGRCSLASRSGSDAGWAEWPDGCTQTLGRYPRGRDHRQSSATTATSAANAASDSYGHGAGPRGSHTPGPRSRRAAPAPSPPGLGGERQQGSLRRSATAPAPGGVSGLRTPVPADDDDDVGVEGGGAREREIAKERLKMWYDERRPIARNQFYQSLRAEPTHGRRVSAGSTCFYVSQKLQLSRETVDRCNGLDVGRRREPMVYSPGTGDSVLHAADRRQEATSATVTAHVRSYPERSSYQRSSDLRPEPGYAKHIDMDSGTLV